MARSGREFWGRDGPVVRGLGWLGDLALGGEIGCAVLEWPVLLPIALVVGVVGLVAALAVGRRRQGREDARASEAKGLPETQTDADPEAARVQHRSHRRDRGRRS